jgi:hypothetical protein
MDARQQSAARMAFRRPVHSIPLPCPGLARHGLASAAFLAAVVALLELAVGTGTPALAAGYRTQYFIVTASSPEYAKEVAEAAERFRKELAIEWLGRELPPWRDSCPIEVINDSGAGGVTQFYFDRGQPYGWSMRIQGTRERVLDSVLPHEVTHMVFATHFGRPLPRWADEGACTTTEHISERQKQERLLNTFLQTNRGIPFNSMFAMTEYPGDVLPLYAQGYSLTRFLISLEGRRRFIQFVGEGLADRRWAAAVKRNYGFADLSDLQQQWNRWVAKGGHPEWAARFRSGAASQVAANQVAASQVAVSQVAAGQVAVSQVAVGQVANGGLVAGGGNTAAAALSRTRAVPPFSAGQGQTAPATRSVAAVATVGTPLAVVPPTEPLVPVTYPAEAGSPAMAAVNGNPDRTGQGTRVGFTPLEPIAATGSADRPVAVAGVSAEDPYAKTRTAYLREHPEEAARNPQRSPPVRQLAGPAAPKLLLEWSKQPSATVLR